MLVGVFKLILETIRRMVFRIGLLRDRDAELHAGLGGEAIATAVADEQRPGRDQLDQCRAVKFAIDAWTTRS